MSRNTRRWGCCSRAIAAAGLLILPVALLAVLPVPARAAQPIDSPPAGQPGDLTGELLEGLPLGRPPAPSNPLRKTDSNGSPTIAADMVRAASRLQSGQVGRTTQELQASILSRLEKQITGRRSQQSESPRSSTNPQQPDGTQAAASSGETRSPRDGAAQDDLPFDNEALRAIWGHLPERTQQLIRNPVHEEFLPAYRQVIIDYYRRLASDH